MLQNPSINILTQDVVRLAKFYERLGFRETFRTPKDGMPVHVEVTLESLTAGISSVESAVKDHGLHPNLGGRPIAIVLWTDDVDKEYARLMAEEGAQSLSPPHDFLLVNLRAAWIADPDGNPITITQRKKSK